MKITMTYGPLALCCTEPRGIVPRALMLVDLRHVFLSMVCLCVVCSSLCVAVRPLALRQFSRYCMSLKKQMSAQHDFYHRLVMNDVDKEHTAQIHMSTVWLSCIQKCFFAIRRGQQNVFTK